MISGEKIAQYITDFNGIELETIDDLSALTAKFPYCSSLFILKLKHLALTNHIDFENELKNAAAHVSDREQLYAAIHSSTEKIPLEKEETLVVNEESNQESTSTDFESKEVEEDNGNDLEEKTEDIDELDLIINTTAIDTNYVSSIKEEISKDETFEIDQMSTVEINNNETEVKKQPALEQQQQPDEPLSFIDWLKQKQKAQKELVSEPEKKIQEEPEIIEEEKESIDDLLDRFISEEPKISRPVKDFYSPAKNAKKSIEESIDLVSETLAKIHVMQKNYSKAISAYEQLILLYPEKKTFFASQIEKIKEEIKNK